MIFFSDQPNLYVKISNKNLQRLTQRKGFYFNDKGEYETDNPSMIKALKQSFRFEESKPIEPIIEPIEAIETNKEPEIESPKVVKCKKCDFTTDNKGKLLAHYRAEHRK